MTLIYDTVDFWIESFHVPRASLANNTRVITVFTLKKAGRFIGCSTTMDADLAGGIIGNINTTVVKNGGTTLNYGDAISQIQTIHSNSSGITSIIGVHVLVFMRK